MLNTDEKKLYFSIIFDNLKDSIGKEVTCIYWKDGKQEGFRGYLLDVVPYDYIDIEGTRIHFVDQNTAIEYIIIQERDVAYSIYNNPEVKNYRGIISHPQAIIDAQKRFLGVSVNELNIDGGTRAM